MTYPLAKKGSLIGTPGQGTHSYSAAPNNWESDNAVDLGVPVGTPVYAVADGTIGTAIGSLGAASGSRFAGLRLHLKTAGNEYYYAHLSKLKVHAGQKVKAGQLLGYSGSANGVAHLHLGALTGDPRTLLSGKTPTGNAALGSGGTGKANASAGAVGDVVNDVTGAADALNPVTLLNDAIKGAVQSLVDTIGKEGARLLVTTGLVLGGAALALVGISRATGLKPSLDPTTIAAAVAAPETGGASLAAAGAKNTAKKGLT